MAGRCFRGVACEDWEVWRIDRVRGCKDGACVGGLSKWSFPVGGVMGRRWRKGHASVGGNGGGDRGGPWGEHRERSCSGWSTEWEAASARTAAPWHDPRQRQPPRPSLAFLGPTTHRVTLLPTPLCGGTGITSLARPSIISSVVGCSPALRSPCYGPTPPGTSAPPPSGRGPLHQAHSWERIDVVFIWGLRGVTET